MESNTIRKIIAKKHEKDVVVFECKNGPSWVSGHLLKLDAWVMRSSWANPACIGYEIKVNRSDFLQDEKWPNYLKYCNEFYFVCPSGLIYPEELPHDVGLYYVSKNGAKMFCKKKAPYRKVEIPENLYRYILMCRSKIVSDQTCPKTNNKEYWENWLKNKEINRDFGYHVSGSIRETVNKRIEEVEKENKQLKLLVEQTEQTIQILKREGFEIGTHWFSEYKVRNKLKEKLDKLNGEVPEELYQYFDNITRGLEHIKKVLFEKDVVNLRIGA